MSKVLSKYKINFILLQMIAFTFICIMAYVDFFLSYDPKLFVRLTVLSSTILVVLIYEIIIIILFNKEKKKYKNNPSLENEKVNYNEKYLWFAIFLLLDILIIVQIISHRFSNIHIILLLFIALVLFNVISTIVKPYFGIKHKK